MKSYNKIYKLESIQGVYFYACECECKEREEKFNKIKEKFKLGFFDV